MAVADLNVSRRALLGAAFVLPVSAAVPGSDVPPAADARRAVRWEKALARFRGAEAALDGVAHTEDEALYDRVLGRFNAALRGLVRAPAPDLAALSAKLDLAVDQDVASLTGGEACMAALKRDARRLAAAQARG